MQNKYIVIGDVHGRGTWVSTEKYIKEGYKIIFLGDYMDTHDDIDTLSIHMNFLEIIRFKEDYPNDVILLVGNHDYSYLNPIGQCSGYRHQTQFFVNHNRDLFLKHLKVMNMHRIILLQRIFYLFPFYYYFPCFLYIGLDKLLFLHLK